MLALSVLVEQSINVGGFEDRFRCTAARGGENGPAKLFGGEEVLRKKSAEEKEERPADCVESVVPRSLGFDAVHWKDGSDAKHVGGFEGQTEDGVFGLTFDAGPHGAAFFGAVRAGTRDVDKSHLRIGSSERFGDCHGQIEVEAAVVRLR